MRTWAHLCICGLFLSVPALILADDATDTYSKLMKPAAAANATLQKNVGGDVAAAAASATDVQNAFAKIQEFWSMRGVSGAQGFAKNIVDAAKEAHDAAAAGNQAAAEAAAKKIAANCGSCHATHRDKAADGSYTLK